MGWKGKGMGMGKGRRHTTETSFARHLPLLGSNKRTMQWVVWMGRRFGMLTQGNCSLRSPPMRVCGRTVYRGTTMTIYERLDYCNWMDYGTTYARIDGITVDQLIVRSLGGKGGRNRERHSLLRLHTTLALATTQLMTVNTLLYRI